MQGSERTSRSGLSVPVTHCSQPTECAQLLFFYFLGFHSVNPSVRSSTSTILHTQLGQLARFRWAASVKLASSQGPQPLFWYTIQLGNLTRDLRAGTHNTSKARPRELYSYSWWSDDLVEEYHSPRI